MADLSIEDLIRAEEEALTRAREARAAAAVSPEALALSQRAKLASLKAAREAEERGAADDRAWLDAVAEHGEQRVERIHTAAGAIILRAATSQEWDRVIARVQEVSDTALGSGNLSRAATDSEAFMRNALLTGQRIYPSLDAAKAIVARYPGVWEDLVAARNRLNRGPIVAAGKGAAR